MTRVGVGQRQWIAIVVVAVVLSACSSVESTVVEAADSVSQGNVTVFCRAWPDAREKLLGIVTGELTINYQDTDIMLARSLADVDSTVPAEVRPDWDRAYATYQQISDLLFTTGYSEGTIRAVHLKMAFGEAGPEAAVADTQDAVAAIDEWAITECGDFASRWPELERILYIHDGSDWRELADAGIIDRYEAALAVGARLVPEEIVEYWDIAAGYQSAYFDLARSQGFDVENLPEGDEGEAFFIEFVGLSWDEAREASDDAREKISSWVEANPGDAVAISTTSGSPGSLAVRILPHQYLTNRMLLLALMPQGAGFAEMRSAGAYVAATCTDAGESPQEWEQWQAEAARQAKEEGADPREFLLDQIGEHFDRPLLPIAAEGEYTQASICWLISHEADPALVPGGAYELFVGAYYGDPGSYEIYFAAPEYCLQLPVVVDGDTVVDLPELEPCDLEPLGRPEEIARRAPPPFTAAGTLRVEVDSALQPEEFDFCRLDAVLLPAGTTLNDVGRGDVWPSGIFNLHRRNTRDVEGGDELRWARSPGLVPILPMMPSGLGEVHIEPAIRADGPWDIRFPDPVPLATGSYDLRIEEWCEDEDAQPVDRRRSCALLAVDVDGATIVKMPELGACP